MRGSSDFSLFADDTIFVFKVDVFRLLLTSIISLLKSEADLLTTQVEAFLRNNLTVCNRGIRDIFQKFCFE